MVQIYTWMWSMDAYYLGKKGREVGTHVSFAVCRCLHILMGFTDQHGLIRVDEAVRYLCQLGCQLERGEESKLQDF